MNVAHVQDRDIMAGYIPGIRPYVDFSSASLVWQDSSSSDGLSPEFVIDVGHVVQCGEDLFIVVCIRQYFSHVTAEDLTSSSSEDVLYGFGRWGYIYFLNLKNK